MNDLYLIEKELEDKLNYWKYLKCNDSYIEFFDEMDKDILFIENRLTEIRKQINDLGE